MMRRNCEHSPRDYVGSVVDRRRRADRARILGLHRRHGTWWPPENHILQAELAKMVFEPRVGGNVYDIGVDGSECRWSRVLAYEPPNRFVISWDINLQWKIESDPDRTSEVEVRFVAEGPSRTRVELEHRHLDRHGDGWEGMRAAVGSPNGWQGGLEQFAAHVNT